MTVPGGGGDKRVDALEGKVRELAATCATLQSDCLDSRRLAFDADLRLRTHVSQVEESLRAALQTEGVKLRTGMAELGESLVAEQAKRTEQLEQLTGNLGELVQTDLRETGERLRADLMRNAGAHAERVEALEVSSELQRAVQAVALERMEAKAAEQAEQLANDSGMLLDALTRNNEQHARATELLRGHWERRENILAAVEAQSEALAALGRRQQAAVQGQVEAARATDDLRAELVELRSSIGEERTARSEGQEALRREARGESARLERRCEAVGKETRLMQVSVIQQLDRKLEMLVEPLQQESAALRKELETTLDERLRAGEEALAALKEHTERSIEERLQRGEAQLAELSASVDQRLGELSGSVDSRLQASAAELAAVADDSSAGTARLGAQLAAEVDTLRTESNWGFALHGEAVGEEVTRSVDTMQVRLAEDARQLESRLTESLHAVRTQSCTACLALALHTTSSCLSCLI
jgi:hypothetical protein